MWHGAKNRCRRKKVAFDIEVSDIVIPERCPILGMKLKRSRGKQSPNSPSLDRIKPSRGYVKGNVRVISWAANQLKGPLTPKQIRKLYRYVNGD
jgi:hypothetical protein